MVGYWIWVGVGGGWMMEWGRWLFGMFLGLRAGYFFLGGKLGRNLKLRPNCCLYRIFLAILGLLVNLILKTSLYRGVFLGYMDAMYFRTILDRL